MFKFDGMDIKWVRSKTASTIVVCLIVFMAIPFLLPSFVYQNIIENRLEKSTGLDVEFTGDFSFSLLPYIRLEADNVEFNGNLAKDVETTGVIDHVILEIGFWKFLTGNIHIHDFRLQTPKATINGDFLRFLPEWLRKNLRTANKSDIRYEEIFLYLVEESVFDFIEVSEGTLQWNKNKNESVSIQKMRLSIEKPIEGKDFTIEGNAYVNDRSVDLSMRLQRPDDFIRGFRSKLSVQLDSSPLRIDFNGNAAHRQSFVAQGIMRLEIPSIYEYCSWFNTAQTCANDNGRIIIKSDLRLRDQRLQIENATYDNDPFLFNGEGIVSFRNATPEITGTILVPTRPISSLMPVIDAFEKIDFNKLLLETFDANVDVKYQGLKLPIGETLKPQVKILLVDGRLSLGSDQLKMFGGLSSFRLRWHKGIDDGYMDLRFDANSIDMKRLQAALSQDFGITGALKASFEVQSLGSHLVALLETARIHGDFTVLDGSFTAPDVVLSLSGEDASAFEFAEAKARLKGDRGQLSIRDIKFVAPFVDVSGKGNFDFLNNSLKIQLKSKIPARPNIDGSETPAHIGEVMISGPIDNIQLQTSANPSINRPISDGLLSGLLPYTEDQTDDEAGFVIEETDLLD